MKNQLDRDQIVGFISVLNGTMLVLEDCEAILWGEEVALLANKEKLDKESTLLHDKLRNTIKDMQTLLGYLEFFKEMLLIMGDLDASEEEKKRVDSYNWVAIVKVVFKFSPQLTQQSCRLRKKKAEFNYTVLREMREVCKAFIDAIT